MWLDFAIILLSVPGALESAYLYYSQCLNRSRWHQPLHCHRTQLYCRDLLCLPFDGNLLFNRATMCRCQPILRFTCRFAHPESDLLCGFLFFLHWSHVLTSCLVLWQTTAVGPTTQNEHSGTLVLTLLRLPFWHRITSMWSQVSTSFTDLVLKVKCLEAVKCHFVFEMK